MVKESLVEKKVFGTPILPLALFLLAAVISFNYFVFSIDEYTYLNNAVAFSQGNTANVLEVARFPFWPYFLSFFAGFNLEVVGKVFSLLFSLGALALTYFFAKKYFGEKKAFYSALFLATNPFFVFFSSRVLTESPYVFFLLAAVYALAKSVEKPVYLIAFGALTAFLVLTRYLGFYLLPLALAYFLLAGEKKLLFSKWTIYSAIAFFAVLTPFLLYSLKLTGNLVGLFTSFFFIVVGADQSFFSLPDKIPSYLLALFFLTAFLTPFLLAFFSRKQNWLDKKYLLLLLCTIGLAFVLEAYGRLNTPLLRYIAVLAPFASILAAIGLDNVPKRFSFFKKLVSVLIVLNLLAGIGIIWFFGLGFYPKHFDYRNAGLAVKDCVSVYSNIEPVTIHYTGKRNVELNKASCVVQSTYDPPFDPPKDYSSKNSFGKVNVFQYSRS